MVSRVPEIVTREDWEEKLRRSKLLMQERGGINKILIEVAAQHPLVDGRYPNEEFKNRLLLGKKLYHLNKKSEAVIEIYVPGSRHKHQGIADKISLSQAGRDFLIENGVPAEIIHGDDLNTRYKGELGVYDSADECFVAASYFRNEGFGQLLSVVSPVQLTRKALHYIWFGVMPLLYSAPAEKSYHNWVGEVFELIPYVLGVDPSLQGPASSLANQYRQERIP